MLLRSWIRWEESIGPLEPFVVKEANLAGGKEIRVIHSILPQGPKLVELDDEAASAIDQNRAVLRLPIVMYDRPFNRPLTYRRQTREAFRRLLSLGQVNLSQRRGSVQNVTIRVLEKKKGRRVPIGSGLLVTAFSNCLKNEGDEKVTDDSGKVIMQLSGNTIEQLYCEQLWRWGAFRQNIPVHPSIDLELEPLN